MRQRGNEGKEKKENEERGKTEGSGRKLGKYIGMREKRKVMKGLKNEG